MSRILSIIDSDMTQRTIARAVAPACHEPVASFMARAIIINPTDGIEDDLTLDALKALIARFVD